MNEISKRLIDGNRMIADYEREKAFNESIGKKERAWDILTFIVDLESDKYLVPSNQGESAILREALKRIAEYQRDFYESPLHAYDNCKIIAREALSSTEDTAPSISSMGLMLKPEDGIQKVQYKQVDRRIHPNGMRETVYQREDGSEFHVAVPRQTILLHGELQGYTYDEEAEKRCADRMFGITIPGINEGGEQE